MFIQTEATPNPATLKFIPGRPGARAGDPRVPGFRVDQGSPLAARLFEIDGVTGVFLGSDFISVSKGEGEWQHLKPAILGAIMEHYQSGAPVAAEVGAGSESAEEGEFFAPEDAETVNTIKELLETRVRPAVAQDGGDITFQGYRDGIVFLHMRGACSRLPELDGDAPSRHRESAAPLHSGGAGGSPGVTEAAYLITAA